MLSGSLSILARNQRLLELAESMSNHTYIDNGFSGVNDVIGRSGLHSELFWTNIATGPFNQSNHAV